MNTSLKDPLLEFTEDEWNEVAESLKDTSNELTEVAESLKDPSQLDLTYWKKVAPSLKNQSTKNKRRKATISKFTLEEKKKVSRKQTEN